MYSEPNYSYDSLKSNENISNFKNNTYIEGSYSNSKRILGNLTFNDIYDENISKSLFKITEIFESNKEGLLFYVFFFFFFY